MGTLRCVACQICEKECPPQCILIEKSKDKKPDAVGKPQIYPVVFDIDISVCMSCQICVEVCPFEAIKMDQVFEIATADRFQALLLDREQLAKPNSYYHQIHPAEAAEVDGRLAAERKAAEEKARAAAAAKAAAAAAKAAARARRAAAPPPRPPHERLRSTTDSVAGSARRCSRAISLTGALFRRPAALVGRTASSRSRSSSAFSAPCSPSSRWPSAKSSGGSRTGPGRTGPAISGSSSPSPMRSRC